MSRQRCYLGHGIGWSYQVGKGSIDGCKTSVPRRNEICFPIRNEDLLCDEIRPWRWTFHPPSYKRAIPRAISPFLRHVDRLSHWLSPLATDNLSGLEAGKHPDGRGWISGLDRFWSREEARALRSIPYFLWNTWLLGTWNSLRKRSFIPCWLVVYRHPDVRVDGWVSAVLYSERRRSHVQANRDSLNNVP